MTNRTIIARVGNLKFRNDSLRNLSSEIAAQCSDLIDFDGPSDNEIDLEGIRVTARAPEPFYGVMIADLEGAA